MDAEMDSHDFSLLHMIAVLLPNYHRHILKEVVYALNDFSVCSTIGIKVRVIVHPRLLTGVHLAAQNVVKSS